jgi:hypothetical protein
MGYELTLPRSQEPEYDPRTEADEFSPHPRALINTILLSTPGSQMISTSFAAF